MYHFVEFFVGFQKIIKSLKSDHQGKRYDYLKFSQTIILTEAAMTSHHLSPFIDGAKFKFDSIYIDFLPCSRYLFHSFF